MQIRCPHCHVPFDTVADASWTDLTCPACEQSFSLSGDAETCSYGPGVHVLGRFELLQQVGAGKFGSVWKARDSQLQRYVAVKIPRQRDLNARETEIFFRDARAAAQLRHPSIASVHEVGRENDTVYIVSDFIDGANLSEWLTGKRPTTRESVELVIKIADALEHAHEAGVVHRDLKPGNIMLDRRGEPYVIDFGLALREVGEMTITVDGQLLGTPAYMPPEQARGEGHHADRRSDIYSLGVILFRLLTGELPFRGEARMLIVQILNEDAPSPRRLNADVHRDLETITLKCLEKEPTKRYQTARELADDLCRWLADEPIKARPVGRLERGWRWCKRHPEVALLSAVLLLLLGAVSIIAPIVAVHEASLRRESDRRGIELQYQVASNMFQRAAEEYNAGRLVQGIALLAAVAEQAGSQNPLRQSLLQLMPGWSAEAGRPIVYGSVILAAAISRDGRTAVFGAHQPEIRLWNLPTGTPFGKPLSHRNSIRAVAFSPDGERVVTGSADGTAKLWNARTGEPIGNPMEIHAQDAIVWAVCFSRDGSVVATGSTDGAARLWDAHTGEPKGDPMDHGARVLSVAISPDGSAVLSGGFDGKIHVWNAQTQQPMREPIDIGKPVYAIVYSPDGSKILIASGTEARLWNPDSWQPEREIVRNKRDEVYAAAFSPDGRTVLTGSFDNTARLWDLATRQQIGQSLEHGGIVMAVAFTPDGHAVVTGSADGTARIWNIHVGRTLHHDGAVNAAIFDTEGQAVFTASADKTARRWNSRTGEQTGESMRHEQAVTAIALNKDGTALFTGTHDGRIKSWNASSGEAAGEGWQVDGKPVAIECCGDGKSVLIQCDDNKVQLWDSATRAPLSPLRSFDRSETLMARSPDGRTILVVDNNTARLFDVVAGAARGDPLQHKVKIMAAVFSGDGRTVVTGGYDHEVRRWNASTGDAIGQVFRHDGIVYSVACDHSARLILSGSGDRTARVWDSQTGKAISQPHRNSYSVSKVALSPNGRLALSINEYGEAGLWDVPSGRPLGRPLQHEVAIDEEPFTIVNGRFSPDSDSILFQCADGTARLYDVPQTLPDDPQRNRTWARVRSGIQLDASGALHQLSPAEWLEAQRQLEQPPRRD